MAVDIVIGLFVLGALATFIWGLVKLFRKGHRKRGLLLLCGAFALLMASSFFIGIQQDQEAQAAGYASHEEYLKGQALQTQADRVARIQAEQDRLKALARAQGYENHAAQQEAERLAERQAQREQLGDFPSLEVKARADALGISRYAAYRLLNDQNTITAYCEYSDAVFAISRARDTAIDSGGDSTAAHEHAEAQHQALLDKYTQQLGLEEHELFTLPAKGHWDWQCRAQDLGWVAVTKGNLESVTRSQAKQAQAILKTVYEDQLKNGSLAVNVFDPDRRGFVTCQRENVADMWFVRCQAKGYSRNSPLHHYAVAWHQGQDYPLLVALNGQTMTTWEKIGTDAQRRIEEPFAPAIYAGPSLPISEVLETFN